MVDLPERKVGIVACSGEEIPEGTVSRLAALKVLHELKRGETVTICLPLFLAGGEEERTFAKFYPTITIDGCELKCAFHGTERHSSKPVEGFVVSELMAERGFKELGSRRRLNEAGKQVVDMVAGKIAASVERILGRRRAPAVGNQGAETAGESHEEVVVTCSCGSGVPVKKLTIAGRTVEVVALPLIMAKFQKEQKQPDEAGAKELLETVKIYNEVPAEEETAWREVLIREYEAYCRKETSR